MDRVPESTTCELLEWIARERDAAWTAKLAVLRVQGCGAIAHLGACVREHDRHAEELGKLLRAGDRTVAIPTEPTFVTRDAFVVGSLDESAAVLGALLDLERERVRRYEQRPACSEALEAILVRHLTDARARLGRLATLGASCCAPRRAAA